MDKVLLASTDELFLLKAKRSVKNYEFIYINGDININIITKYIRQYNPGVIVIHHSVRCMNVSVLLDYLITNKVVPVVYITNTAGFGQFYNVVNDVYFYYLEENKSEVLEPVLEILGKIHFAVKNLNKRILLLETKTEDEIILLKAKIRLMEKNGLSESEAHKAIIKQAMDKRLSKEKIARLILEND